MQQHTEKMIKYQKLYLTSCRCSAARYLRLQLVWDDDDDDDDDGRHRVMKIKSRLAKSAMMNMLKWDERKYPGVKDIRGRKSKEEAKKLRKQQKHKEQESLPGWEISVAEDERWRNRSERREQINTEEVDRLIGEKMERWGRKAADLRMWTQFSACSESTGFCECMTSLFSMFWQQFNTDAEIKDCKKCSEAASTGLYCSAVGLSAFSLVLSRWNAARSGDWFPNISMFFTFKSPRLILRHVFHHYPGYSMCVDVNESKCKIIGKLLSQCHHTSSVNSALNTAAAVTGIIVIHDQRGEAWTQSSPKVFILLTKPKCCSAGNSRRLKRYSDPNQIQTRSKPDAKSEPDWNPTMKSAKKWKLARKTQEIK